MISVLIPTLGRASRLRPLVDNVRMTSPVGRYELVFAIDYGDEETRIALAAMPGLDLKVVHENGSYPHKTNAAFREARGDLILPTADDVRFHEGWIERASAAFADESVQVVGTNDLSPATENGDHATMPILRRSYIEDPGAAYGEPGTIFFEGYHHNFCETELWGLARARGVARFDPSIVIEHLHPDWGKREEDQTDARGMRSGWDADAALFSRRVKIFR